jgi:starvation-inducible outer membrane lipoprotein
MLVWGGTVTPDPTINNYPDEDDIGPTPEAYVGQQVTLGGTVVATDPTSPGSITPATSARPPLKTSTNPSPKGKKSSPSAL